MIRPQQTSTDDAILRAAWRSAPEDWAFARVSSAVSLLRTLIRLGADDSGTWLDAILLDQGDLAAAYLGAERYGERPHSSRQAVIGRTRDLERLSLIVSRGTHRRGERVFAPTCTLEAIQAAEVAA